VTGRIQSLIRNSESQPGKVGESGRGHQECLDAESETYNEVCKLILPYLEGLPLSGPDVEMSALELTSADGTPLNESIMDHDITPDFY